MGNKVKVEEFIVVGSLQRRVLYVYTHDFMAYTSRQLATAKPYNHSKQSCVWLQNTRVNTVHSSEYETQGWLVGVFQHKLHY